MSTQGEASAESVSESVSIADLLELSKDPSQAETSHEISTLASAAIGLSRNDAPEGWESKRSLADRIGANPITVRRIADQVLEEHPEWTQQHVHPTMGRVIDYLSPEAVQETIEQVTVLENIPQDWVRIGAVAKQLKATHDRVAKVVKALEENHPDWVYRYQRSTNGPVISYISPEAIVAVANTVSEVRNLPPEGWETVSALAKRLGLAYQTVYRHSVAVEASHPEWSKEYQHPVIGGTYVHFNPNAIKLITESVSVENLAPEGWVPRASLADRLGVSSTNIGRMVNKLRDEHPEQLQLYWNSHLNQSALYISPEAIEAFDEAKAGRISEPAPEGWETRGSLASKFGIDPGRVYYFAKSIKKAHPEWMRDYLHLERKRVLPYFSPEAVEYIAEAMSNTSIAPEGWETRKSLTDKLGAIYDRVEHLANAISVEHPDWVQAHQHPKIGRTVDYLSPEAVAYISEALQADRPDAPDGWQTRTSLVTILGVSKDFLENAASSIILEHPDWVQDYYHPILSRVYTFYSPELVDRITAIVEDKTSEKNLQSELDIEQRNLEQSLDDLLSEASEGKSTTTKSFNELIGLFGAETAIDILYQQHPDYKKLPMPYVKSKLAEYLGEFLPARGGFSLEGLENGIAFLANPLFKDSLTELVKNDCLKLLNRLAKTAPEDVDLGAVVQYIAHIREQSSEFSNSELQEVLRDVEAYYELLFENIHKPNYLVDQLDDGRLFPDINQRINVQEIAFKHKILIADEMGTGKSASVIMAKEILGVKQALVVVPSNVVAVWRDYLSDKVAINGKQIGYFKEGDSPRVLIVNSIDDLTDANPGAYDYVVISQERLNDRYTSALEDLNYDMLIVDEVHKLKNISSGVRSANLVKLAEHVGDDKYLALLSGTPVPNKISDIALTLKLLYPERFKDADDKHLTNQIINGDILDLRSLLVPRMQMKSLAENIDMPTLNEVTESIELSEREKEIYELLIEEDELTASEKLAVLRQFNLNSRMLDATPDLVGTKVTKVGEALSGTFEQKDKVVMFVNGYIENVMRGSDTIIADLNLPENVEVLTIDGSVSKEARLEIQAQLQESGRKILLLVSGQTADTGVDFSAADEVYHYNEPWSVYDKQQQTARVYRPGLEDDLTVRTFITEGTIERGIHEYIGAKHLTVEKLLRGIPISEIEKNMLRQEEKQADSTIEVSPELAKYYFSAADKMAKIYGHVKEMGENDFRKFLTRYDKEYANSYADLVGSRSYQANVSRLSGSLIKEMSQVRGQRPQDITVLDLASGPEMLRRHIADDLADSVVSLDINQEHFKNAEGKTITGSFVHVPVANNSIDYVNLSLGLHYTSFVPGRNNYERLETLKETNRILRVGGRATIGMIHSLALSDDSVFDETVSKLGLKVVREYTGVASSGKNFQTQVITLEKVEDCKSNIPELVKDIGPLGLKSLKFKKVSSSLIDTRKMIKKFLLGETAIDVHFNSVDKNVLDEEDHLITEMETLKDSYVDIENIPKDEILSRGFSRIFNGKRYVLFKRLITDTGAVAIR